MRYSPLFLIVVGLVLTISSCIKDNKDQNTSSEVVNVQLYTAPATLHPIFGSLASSSINVLIYTTEQLTIFDPETGKPRGWLAEDMPVVTDSNKTMTYTLRKAAAWPDGAPITNKDVLFSFKFAICPVSSSPRYIVPMTSLIESVETPDDDPRKIIVKCGKSGLQNPYALGTIPIIDRRFFDPEGALDNWSVDQLLAQDTTMFADSTLAKWGRKVTSGDYQIKPEFLKGTSGPYQIVEWEQRNYVKISRRPNYWGKNEEGFMFKQGPSQMVFRQIRDMAALKLQLKQGAIDVVTFMQGPAWEDFSEEESITRNYNLMSGPKTSGLALFMNCKPGEKERSVAMGDWRVRRAIAHLFSTEAYNEQFYAGKGVPITNPVPLLSDDYHKGLATRVKSRDSASYWLDQAGWKDLDGDLIREKVIDGKQVELSAELTYIMDNSTADFGKEIIAEAKAVGFNMEGKALDIKSVVKARKSRNYDLVFGGVGTGHAPYEFTQQWTSKALKGGSNYSGYTNPILDSLNEVSNNTYDLEARRPIMRQMQEIWYHDQPAVMIINLATFGVVHKRLGMRELSTVSPYLWVNTLGTNKE